jgi:hypothetical protein
MPRRFLFHRAHTSASSSIRRRNQAILMPHHAIWLRSAAFLLWLMHNNYLDMQAAEHILMRTTIDQKI